MKSTSQTKGRETMQQTAQTTPNGNKAKPVTTGEVDASKPAADVPAAASAEADKPEAAKKGQQPKMPACIVYKNQDGTVSAAIHHPLDGSSYIETGKGVGSAVGALVDVGFLLTDSTNDGPEWIQKKLPKGATLLGYRGIKSYPLPKQP